MVDEKVIFFMGFLECMEDDTCDLSLVESECSIVGPADQVVGVDVLNDSQWTSHGMGYAKLLPKHIQLPEKEEKVL